MNSFHFSTTGVAIAKEPSPSSPKPRQSSTMTPKLSLQQSTVPFIGPFVQVNYSLPIGSKVSAIVLR
jgi:hypothetical protein